MSDFGSELGNSGLNLLGKLLDAILKLISKIYSTFMEKTSADYKLKKAEYKKLQEKEIQEKFTRKIEGKSGFVEHDKLIKAGVPLAVTEITLDDEGFKELAARCKREGIIISGVEDIRDRELRGVKSMIVECRHSDLPKLAKLIDLMNDEKQIAFRQNEVENIKNKDGDLTEEDKLVIAELEKQIDEIRQGHSQELNKEQANSVVEKAVNGETKRGVNFNEALDRWTGGKIDKDTICYVVDAKDPNKYIICAAKNDTFKDQDYVKTTYEVYNGSKQVYATNDGRFEDRPKDYWMNEKKEIKEVGGFGNLVIKFYSLKELQAYQENYKMQNETELNGLEVGKEGRDYDNIIKTLGLKIDESGGTFKDGVVFDKETEKPMILSADLSEVNKARVAEAVVIGKQIVNYKEISQCEEKVAVARANVLMAQKGTPEFKMAQEDFNKAERDYKSALQTELNLIEERKGINAVQAEQGVSNDRESIVIGQEKEDNRRDDRIDELDEKQQTMAEYKGAINDKRNEGVKGPDVKDREATKTKTPKIKEDR